MNSLTDIRTVWAEVNLDNLAHNLKEVKRICQRGTIITAVVKADAYGHGVVRAAKTFLEAGADRLAVAKLSEGLELRKNSIVHPILVLGYTPASEGEKILENNLIQTVYSLEEATKLSEIAQSLNKTLKVHIKIDSGMGRLGFLPDDRAVESITNICKLKNIEVEGIYTHLALADEKDKTFTLLQMERFQWVIKALEEQGVNIPIKHISNSAAIIDLDDFNLDMVRAGIMLYGLYPSNEVNKLKVNLKPAMTLKCRVSNVKEMCAGNGISYGHIYKTDKTAKIATLTIGYADGFTRMLSGKGEVSINGKRVPIIGRICMDQSMIEVTGTEDVKVGDEVIIFGDGSNNSPHIDEVATMLNTINYEIVCMVGRRVPRVYVSNGEIVDVKDYLID